MSEAHRDRAAPAPRRRRHRSGAGRGRCPAAPGPSPGPSPGGSVDMAQLACQSASPHGWSLAVCADSLVEGQVEDAFDVQVRRISPSFWNVLASFCW